MDLKQKEEKWRPKPGVINAEMIRQAVSHMLKDDVPGNTIDEDEGYDFHEITHLFLEHMDILRIDHLWIMPSLKILKLTGNLIEKIENLETLVNLVDLNLSFNKIKLIENLDKLVNLRSLSLYSNLISEIRNLDKLTNLKIFTIGKNKIEDKECILELRKLNLFSLNMAGNPCAEQTGFREYVAAYMPHLQYYEYMIISQEEREGGRIANLINLELLEREEAAQEKVEKETKVQTKKEDEYTRAFVEGLDLDQLYEAMIADDPSGQAMMLIGDEVEELFNIFKEQIRNATTPIFSLGLEQLQLRDKEVELYEQGVQDAVVKSRAGQRVILEKFLELKSEMFLELNELWEVLTQETSDGSMRRCLEEEVDKANMVCNKVKKELFSLELTLSEQLKEVFANFECSLGDMVNSFIETAQGYFTTMREHETTLSEHLGDQAARFLAQLTVRNEDLSTIAPPLRPIMVDKEAVNQAVASSHDIHLQLIDNREDQLMSRARSWYQKLCLDYEQEETARFRGRISEIVSFLELQSREFQQYNIAVDDDIFVFGD